MPFIKQDRRVILDKDGIKAAKEPGELCYVAYKTMVTRWKADPRWKTAHEIYCDLLTVAETPDFPGDLKQVNLFNEQDLQAAVEQAWQVFFEKYLYPYELDQIKLNGDI
jgi:hypothetical protein